jgi:hypothetical protein
MSKTMVLRGADIKLYLNGKVYKEVQQLSYTIEKGEQPIYGIDNIFPQEITATKVSVTGSISGIRIRYSGGLQGLGVSSLIRDAANSPYISLRIEDRSTGEDILYIESIKTDSENVRVAAKGIVNVSFKFQGMVPMSHMDKIS